MAKTWKGPSDSMSLGDLTRRYRRLDINSGTQLVDACWKGDCGTVTNLLREGLDANFKDCSQDTPLHAASSSRNGSGVVKILLDHGAVVNSRNKLKVTPLHRAATEGHIGTVWLLINHGAVLNPRDEFNSTPLHAASSRGHAPVVSTLLDAGAPVDPRDLGGSTPLIRAVARGHRDVVEVLLKRGAALQVANKRGQTPISIACSLSRDADPSMLHMVSLLRSSTSSGAPPLTFQGQDTSSTLAGSRGKVAPPPLSEASPPVAVNTLTSEGQEEGDDSYAGHDSYSRGSGGCGNFEGRQEGSCRRMGGRGGGGFGIISRYRVLPPAVPRPRATSAV